MMIEALRDSLLRTFIAITVLVIVAAYISSQETSFHYERYEEKIDHLYRLDAELNAYIALTRFGIIKHYDPISEALNDFKSIIEVFQKQLEKYPNSTINLKLKAVENIIAEKDQLVQQFKRTNPILTNAILQFSDLTPRVIEGESSDQAVEGGLEQTIQSQEALTASARLTNKINQLFGLVLMYIVHKEKPEPITSLLQEIRSTPNQIENLDYVLIYTDKILQFQPIVTQLVENIFEINTKKIFAELNEGYSKEFEVHNAKGRHLRIILYLSVLVLSTMLYWAFSRLRGTVNTLHIEVQRKVKAEKELENINRQLEQRVTERTRELTVKNHDLNQALGNLKEAQDQLIIQEKMASVGMLTTGIAHEIKNPLNFVNNFSDISIELLSELNQALVATKEKLLPETFDFIEEILNHLKVNCSKIKEHGERADNIVKTMLLHSQVSGSEKELVNINLLLENNIPISLESFQANKGKFEIKLEKNFDPSLQTLPAIPQALARVFAYVIDNALYALKEKQLKIGSAFQPILKISTQQLDHTIVIKIRDNGIGIAKKVLDKVFEPFFTTKPTGKGNTGLGLSICYDTVVKQHKGELKVTSEEGVFTEFTIVLP